MTEIVFHHYPQSPVAEKVRVVFGIKQLHWRSVEIPRIPPKPDLMPLTGGYRRTPVLQVGADIYCDSQCIMRELERRFHKVEEVAANREFQAVVAALLADPELRNLRARLNEPQFNPNLSDTEISDDAVAARREYRQHEARQALQEKLDGLLESDMPVASWFFNDPQGLQLARAPKDESPRAGAYLLVVLRCEPGDPDCD